MEQLFAQALEYWRVFVGFADKHPLITWGAISSLLSLAIAERSRVDAWAERHPYMAALGKTLRAFGIDPWHLIAAASLLVNKRLPPASKRATSLPTILPLLVLGALCLSGCAGSLEQSRAVGQNERRLGAVAAPAGTPERCAELDDRAAFWGGGAKVGAALASGAGLSSVAVDGDDRRDLKTGLQIGAVVAAAAAAGAFVIAESATRSWARECQK